MPQTESHRPCLTGLEYFLASRALSGPKYSFPRLAFLKVPGCFSWVHPELHRHYRKLWAQTQAQQGSPCPALRFVIWPFITGSGQALIILPRPPSQPHTDWKCSLSCLSQTLLSQPWVLLLPPSAASLACPAKGMLEPRNSRA